MVKKKLTSKREIIYQICLSGFLVALLIIFKAIFKFVDIINGYSPQVQMIIYVYAMIILKNYWFKVGFYLIGPFITMIFGISGNIFLDYLVPYYGFGLFLLFDLLTKNHTAYSLKNVIWVNSLMTIFNFIGYGIMGISYIMSGVYFYHAPIYSSFILNIPIVIISFGINLIVMFFCTFPLINLVTKFNNKIFW